MIYHISYTIYISLIYSIYCIYVYIVYMYIYCIYIQRVTYIHIYIYIYILYHNVSCLHFYHQGNNTYIYIYTYILDLLAFTEFVFLLNTKPLEKWPKIVLEHQDLEIATLSSKLSKQPHVKNHWLIVKHTYIHTYIHT